MKTRNPTRAAVLADRRRTLAAVDAYVGYIRPITLMTLRHEIEEAWREADRKARKRCETK